MFHKSLPCSVLPKLWKTAIVGRRLKRQSPIDVRSYHPISLTLSACKLLEIIVGDSLLGFFNSLVVFGAEQNGFLSGGSTLTKLTPSVNRWLLNYDRQVETEVAYVDLEMTLNSVCHHHFVWKIGRCGVGDAFLSWFASYLADRTSGVKKKKAGDAFLDEFSISNGVPQGSILRPSLFHLHINELPEMLLHKCKSFADDVKLYLSLMVA